MTRIKSLIPTSKDNDSNCIIDEKIIDIPQTMHISFIRDILSIIGKYIFQKIY